MDVTYIRINDSDCLSVSGRIILTEIGLSFKYENGKITDTSDGWKVKCVLPDNNYEKLTVKVKSKPPITQEQIDNSGDIIYGSFEDFTCRIYRDFRNNSYGLSCNAKAVVVIK